jgi:hypothetical protein
MSAPERIWIDETETHMLCNQEKAEDVSYIRADLAPQWQDIATAPKDGSVFLGYYDDWQCTMIYDRGNKRFLTYDGMNFAYPTAWMPLQTPPEPAP